MFWVILSASQIFPSIDLPALYRNNVFNTTIVGDYAVVASGSGFKQDVSQVIRRGDEKSLLQYLQELGLPQEHLQELKDAIREDGDRPSKKFGTRVLEWIGKMTAKAGEGAWNIAVQTAPTIITNALSKYYGWG